MAFLTSSLRGGILVESDVMSVKQCVWHEGLKGLRDECRKAQVGQVAYDAAGLKGGAEV